MFPGPELTDKGNGVGDFLDEENKTKYVLKSQGEKNPFSDVSNKCSQMSWIIKLWGKKSKNKELDRNELRKVETLKEDKEAEKNKLRHSLSVSRSGRFKKKNRERGGILEDNFFQQGEVGDQASGEIDDGSNTHAQAQTSGHTRSPSNTCREVTGQIPGVGLQAGQSNQLTYV